MCMYIYILTIYYIQYKHYKQHISSGKISTGNKILHAVNVICVSWPHSWASHLKLETWSVAMVLSARVGQSTNNKEQLNTTIEKERSVAALLEHSEKFRLCFKLIAVFRTTTTTNQPTNQPTSQPANQPTSQPANQPTSQPANQPTSQPANQPTSQPATQPTNQPTQRQQQQTKADLHKWMWNVGKSHSFSTLSTISMRMFIGLV